MGVKVRFQVGGWEFHGVSEFVLGAAERAVQAEAHRLVGYQFQVLAIDLQRRALFGSARGQAQGPERIAFRVNPYVVGSRQSTADQQSGPGAADIRVVGCAYGYGEIQVVIF